MMRHIIPAGIAALCYAMVAVGAGSTGVGAGPTGVCRQAANPTGGNFLPGKYFETRARERLGKDDPTGALTAFEQASYYGNRDAQYGVALLHLKGAKNIPIDVPLGIAWLQIGAQYGHSPSISALKELEPALTSTQREMSVRYFQDLKAKYGVAATRPRVIASYQRERGLSVFADWICKDGTAIPGDKYIAQIDEEFSDYVTAMYGKVTVEPLQPVSDANAKVPAHPDPQ